MKKKITLALSLIVFNFISWSSAGQTVKFTNTELTLGQIFQNIEKQTDYRFVYSPEDVNIQDSVHLNLSRYELPDLLSEMALKANLIFTQVDRSIVVKPAGITPKDGKVMYQKIKGQVTDKQTGTPLAGATVIVEEYLDKSGMTNGDGDFEIKVPVGRLTLRISYLGYDSQRIPLLLNSVQEPFLNLILEPSVSDLKEVIVTAEHDKSKTLNQLVYGSGRSFSIDEANRYAGTLGDPARMVRSYAGVVPERDDRNDIIIRGNSPSFIQWRLEDIEIPNPNHFGGIGLTGNTLTLLNSNLVDNSDFLTGAFPSEYGNVLSGVFDLNMRKPNSTKHEFRAQTGWNGFELGAEGPFSKNNPQFGTYMLAYRYSLLDLVSRVGIDYGILPKFQDVTFKVDIPVSNKLKISGLGIWGTSFIELDDRDKEEEEKNLSYGEHLITSSDIAIGGLKATYLLGNKTTLVSGINVLKNVVATTIDTFDSQTNIVTRLSEESSGETRYTAFADITHYCSVRNRIKVGLRWDTYAINYNQTGVSQNDIFEPIVNSAENMHVLRLFYSNEYRFSSRFRGRAGMHAMFLLMNGTYALEPRGALQYKLTNRQRVSVSYGNHHQMLPRTLFFVETNTGNEKVLTNKNLKLPGAHHFVAGHDLALSKNMRLKTEAYFQRIYAMPIENNPSSTFSLSNVGADFYIPLMDSLVNEGHGRNYGIELTLEKFLSSNYYFLFNTSVFQSEYKTMNNEWRSTAFNVNYIVNALAGYEWWATPTKAFGFDVRLTWAGGKRYIPVDEEASVATGEVVYDYSLAYKRQYKDYFRTDIKLYYRMNFSKVFIEFFADLQNVTNSKNLYQQQFMPQKGEYKSYYHTSFFPMFTFRCLF